MYQHEGFHESIVDHVNRAVILAAPDDRRRVLAETVRDHAHGRFPGDESLFLAFFAHYAMTDGDTERARSLFEFGPPRFPSMVALTRHSLIRINGEPQELIADTDHHLAFLTESIEPLNPSDGLDTVNRGKLRDEVARILD